MTVKPRAETPDDGEARANAQYGLTVGGGGRWDSVPLWVKSPLVYIRMLPVCVRLEKPAESGGGGCVGGGSRSAGGAHGTFPLFPSKEGRSSGVREPVRRWRRARAEPGSRDQWSTCLSEARVT
eukprot:1740664-Rhodomonas_salina.1